MSAVAQIEIAEPSSHKATRSQIRGSGLLVMGYVLELAINFLPHLLLVRYLTTASYGTWAYAISLITAFQTFTLCLNDGLQRFVPIYHEQRDYGRLFGCIVVAFGTTVAIGCAFVSAFYFAPQAVAKVLQEKQAINLLLLLVVLIPVEAVEVMLMRLFACFHKARQIFYLQHVATPLCRLVLVLLLIVWSKDLKFLALGRIAIAIHTTILYGWMLVRLMRQEGLFRDLRHRIVLPFRQMFYFSSPMILSTALSMLENALIVLLLQRSHGITAVAFYRVVLPVAAINNMVMNAFSWLYVPSAARLLARNDYSGINHLYWRTAGWICVLTFPIFAITFCFAGPLTMFLYGQRYAQSAMVLAVLAIANYSNVALGFNGVTLKVLGKIKYVLASNLTTSTVKITLFFLLIPWLGPIGAALAFATGVLVYNLLMQLGLHSAARVQLFEKEYLSFFLMIAFSTCCLLSIRLLTGNNIYLAGTFTLLASWMVLITARKQLKIAETFPEMRRLPLVGHLFA